MNNSACSGSNIQIKCNFPHTKTVTRDYFVVLLAEAYCY